MDNIEPFEADVFRSKSYDELSWVQSRFQLTIRSSHIKGTLGDYNNNFDMTSIRDLAFVIRNTRIESKSIVATIMPLSNSNGYAVFKLQKFIHFYTQNVDNVVACYDINPLLCNPGVDEIALYVRWREHYRTQN